MWFPVVRLVVKREPLEEFPLPLEDGLQRRDQQRLPEAARTRQEVQFLRRPDQLPDILRLVHIQEVALDQILEGVDAGGQILHRLSTSLPPAAPSAFKARGHPSPTDRLIM